MTLCIRLDEVIINPTIFLPNYTDELISSYIDDTKAPLAYVSTNIPYYGLDVPTITYSVAPD